MRLVETALVVFFAGVIGFFGFEAAGDELPLKIAVGVLAGVVFLALVATVGGGRRR